MANLQLMHCFFLVTIISLSWDGAQARMCLDILDTDGYTYPQGDIILEKGSDLNITCVLNKKPAAKYGPNASRLLSFFLDRDPVPSEILNATARRLLIKNHPTTRMADYYCMLNHTEYVCHNIIAVGTKPQDVTDFECMGEDLNNFTCTWTAPRNNIKTDYKLDYTPVLRTQRSYSPCPHEFKEPNINGSQMLSCTWSLSTSPQYRHSQPYLEFGLFANNTFGARNWTFFVNHFSRVRPGPPKNLTAISKSPHSINLNWSIPYNLKTFPRGFRYRVSYCNEHSNECNTIYFPIKNLAQPYIHNRDSAAFRLDNLPYANCVYSISISMRPKLATDNRMWSQNRTVITRTLPKIPDCPPNTTQSGFEILDGIGKRIIYWQNIHRYQENGRNFSYNVQAVEDPSIKPVEVFKTYAVFNKLPNRNLTFKIWSVNSEGRSLEHSVVFVPAQKYALEPIRKLMKEDKGNGEYNVQWIHPGNSKISNYTLFWCAALMERPYPCEGNLNWLILDRGMKNKTLSLPSFDNEGNRSIGNYQFAMSVNGIDSSSGLLWADCTILPGSGKRKLNQAYLKAVSSRYIVIQIQLGCITLSHVRGFNVSYCEFLRPGSEECQPNTLKYLFFGVNNDSFDGEVELNVTDLVPYTGYQFRVEPIVAGLEMGFGPAMNNSTTEDTPSVPLNVLVVRRNPRVLTLHWEPPAEANGRIRIYRIYVKGRNQSRPLITVDSIDNSTKYSMELTGLLPRSEYTIGVSVCTKTCSGYATVNASTDVNFPGVITKPSANWNGSITILKWEKPDEIEALVDFYELQIGATNDNDRVQNFTTHNATFSLGEICEKDQTQTIYVRVRGVNIRNDRKLPGPWSEKADFPCIRSSVSTSWIFSLIAIAILVILLITIFTTRRSVQKAIGQRLCDVKLPSALDAAANVEYSMAEIQGDKKELSQNWNCDTSAKVPSTGYLPCYPEDPNANKGSYVIAGNPLSMPVITQAITTVPEDVSAENYKVLPIETLKLLWQKPAPEVTSAGYVLVGNSKNEKSS